MSVSFFSPICKNQNSPVEKLAFLSITTHFFNFGQSEYTIKLYDSQIFLEEKAGSNPHWIKTLLRIVAICTIIIPLIMCVGIWMYRRTNNFKMHEPNLLNTLPLEILKIIYENAGPACLLQLASTSKTNYAVIESENSLKQYRFVLKAIERVPLSGYSAYDSDKVANAIVSFTKILCVLDLKLAFIMAKSISNNHLFPFKSKALATYVTALASTNSKKALKVAHKIVNLNYKAIAIASVAEFISTSNPEKSKKLAELAFASIRSKNNTPSHSWELEEWQSTYLLALATVSKAFVKISCPNRAQETSDFAFERAKEWNRGDYFDLPWNSIVALAESDWKKTLQISEPSIEDAIRTNDYPLLVFYAKTFILKAPEKALALIKNIINTFKTISKAGAFYFTLKPLCKLLPDLDKQNSLEVADIIINSVNNLMHNDSHSIINSVNNLMHSDSHIIINSVNNLMHMYKAKIYCYLAPVIYGTNPVKTQNLFELAIAEANAIENADDIKTLTMLRIAKVMGLSSPKKSQDLLQKIIELDSFKGDFYTHSLYKSSLAKVLFPLNPIKAIEELDTIKEHSILKLEALLKIGLSVISK